MKVEIKLEDSKCCKGCPLLDWFPTIISRSSDGYYGCLAGFKLSGNPKEDEDVVRPSECVTKNGE